MPGRFKGLPGSKLSEGPPARYQLVPKKESLDGKDEAESRQRRWTLGEKDHTKPNKTILLVGETGTGKSTMINAVVNYVMGVEWQDKVWFEIVEEENNKPSQTKDVTVYEIFGFEGQRFPYCVTIVDTPGYRASEKQMAGEENKQLPMLIQQLSCMFLLEKGIKEINAIGLVLKEDTNRLSDRQQHIFNSVVSLFGKDMEKNIVALITHSNGMSAANAVQALEDADIKWAKDENSEPVHFLFQNCQTADITSRTERYSKNNWDLTEEGMKEFFSFIDMTASKKLNITTDVLTEPIGVAACFEYKHYRKYFCQKADRVPQRFKDIKVRYLSEGPPARYQLVPKKESLDGKDEAESRLRRWTLGEKDHTKPNKIILLVGETGTGKSTMINAMVNYVMGVKWVEQVWFEIVEEGKRSQSQSQTADVTVYDIFGFEGRKVPFSVTIIDTPGYGVTESSRDGEETVPDSTTQKLFDLFRSEKGVQEISTVCLVLKATENRLSDRLKYIFDSVMSLFGKELENNIVALLTFSDGSKSPNALQALMDANIKCAKTSDHQPVNFLFNNYEKLNIEQVRDERFHNTWKRNKKGMNKFFGFLSKAKSEKTYSTLEVLTERIRLTACIGNLENRIELIEMKQKAKGQFPDALEKHKLIVQSNQKFTCETLEKYHSLQKKKQSFLTRDKVVTDMMKEDNIARQKHKQEMEANQNFHREVDEPYIVQQFLGGVADNKAVCCTVCEETCHYPGCTVALSPWTCEVMRFGKCTSCTGKCSHKKHVKEKWMYVNMTRRTTQTLKNVKEKYEMSKKHVQDTENRLGNTRLLKQEHEKTEREITEAEIELTSQIKQLETDRENNEKEIRRIEYILTSISEEIKCLESDKARWVEEAYQHVVKLEEIALNTRSMSTYIHLDFLINKMMETGDMDKVQRLEDIKRRCEEGKTDGIHYFTNVFRKSSKGKFKSLPSSHI